MKLTDWLKVFTMNKNQRKTIRKLEWQLRLQQDNIDRQNDLIKKLLDGFARKIKEGSIPEKLVSDVCNIPIVNITEGKLGRIAFVEKDGKTYVKGDL